MNNLIHADIFFFITTIAVVILAILVSILIYYIVKIAKNLASITETVRKEGENVAGDIAAFREKVRQDRDNMKGLGGFVRKVFMGESIVRNAVKRVKKKTAKHPEHKQ